MKVERGRTFNLKKKYHDTWKGKHKDLPHRVLHMTLVEQVRKQAPLHGSQQYSPLSPPSFLPPFEQTRFGNLVEIGTSELSLLELATGSVQQEVTFSERDGRTTIESYRLNFHVHFQENFAFVMRLTDWSGSKLRSTDETGSSDPFLRFFIRGSRQKRYKNWYACIKHSAHNNPPSITHTHTLLSHLLALHSPRHRYKRGGLMGRSTSTDVQYNTLNPDNMNAKRPLYYYGTRSDLENETLRIEVWDWDPTSANDLIGFAEVPLRGILLSGRISTGLAMYASR